MAAFTRPDPSDRAAFDAHYQRVLSDPDINNQAIEVDGALAGMIASFSVEGNRELTYWIDPSRWGLGIATAAVQVFLRLEAQRPFFARAAEHNPGSVNVLLRNGFVRVDEETSWAAGVSQDITEYVFRLDHAVTDGTP